MGSGSEESPKDPIPGMVSVEEFLALQAKYIKQLEDNNKSGIISSSDSLSGGRAEDFKPPPFVAGASPYQGKSLRAQFPDLKTSLLLEIMRHHVDPGELHKLDVHHRPSSEVKGKSSSNPTKYKSTLDLILPLLTYFRVLGAFAASGSSSSATNVLHVMRGGMMYVSHILDLSTRFQWSAVVRYHLRFHEARIAKMEEGDYSGWTQMDLNLMAETLIGWELKKERSDSGRSSSDSASSRPGRSSKSQQYCFGFGRGDCTSTPCPDGRMHKCRKCDATDHGDKACSKT